MCAHVSGVSERVHLWGCDVCVFAWFQCPCVSGCLRGGVCVCVCVCVKREGENDLKEYWLT